METEEKSGVSLNKAEGIIYYEGTLEEERKTREEEFSIASLPKEGHVIPTSEEDALTIAQKEEIAALTKREYDSLDSIYTRIVGAQDDLQVLINQFEEANEREEWPSYRLNNINDAVCRSLDLMEIILYSEAK